MSSYYNENDPRAAAWLRELISAGLIPKGDVDERSICDVQPGDLGGYIQCHFFCGIAGWSRALSVAGISENEPLWTGSCPCQPFSCAGRGRATEDPRHLWPQFRRLIAERRPPRVFGEQVAGSAGLQWLSGVRADLEDLGYRVGAADLCAASVGAPHIRQRLYWVADSSGKQALRDDAGGLQQVALRGGAIGGMANAGGAEQRRLSGIKRQEIPTLGSDSEACGLGNPDDPRPQGRPGNGGGADQLPSRPASLDGWSNYEIIELSDGTRRRIESGTFPLVARLPGGVVPSGDPSEQEVQATSEARVMRLRGYGNAINPELAAEFITACVEAIGGAQ